MNEKNQRYRKIIIRKLWHNTVSAWILTFLKSYKNIKIWNFCRWSCQVRAQSFVVLESSLVEPTNKGSTTSAIDVGHRCLLYTWINGVLADSDDILELDGMENSTIKSGLGIVYTNKSSLYPWLWEVVIGTKGIFSKKVTSHEIMYLSSIGEKHL